MDILHLKAKLRPCYWCIIGMGQEKSFDSSVESSKYPVGFMSQATEHHLLLISNGEAVQLICVLVGGHSGLSQVLGNFCGALSLFQNPRIVHSIL